VRRERTGESALEGMRHRHAIGALRIVRNGHTDDDEHNSPKYLRTEEHAKELLGEVKPTVPPVLGEQ
ncbi:hypothetical protein AB0346_06690, partial [Nocardia beijingensis]